MFPAMKTQSNVSGLVSEYVALIGKAGCLVKCRWDLCTTGIHSSLYGQSRYFLAKFSYLPDSISSLQM